MEPSFRGETREAGEEKVDKEVMLVRFENRGMIVIAVVVFYSLLRCWIWF